MHLNLSNREVSISHQPKFVDLQYKEIKRKEGANQKKMIIREITIRNKFCKYFCLSSYNMYDELGKKV